MWLDQLQLLSVVCCLVVTAFTWLLFMMIGKTRRRSSCSSKSIEKIPGLSFSIFGARSSSFETLTSDAPLMRKRFGDIYRVWNWFQPIVILCEPKDISEFFRTQRSHTRCFGTFLGRGFTDVLGLMLGASDTTRYARLHSIFAPFYRDSAVEKDHPLIQQCVELFLSEHVRNGKLKLHTAKFEHMPLHILTKLAFGPQISATDLSEMFSLFESHSRTLLPAMCNHWLRIPFVDRMVWWFYPQLALHTHRWQRFCQTQYEKVKDLPPSCGRQDLFFVAAKQLQEGKLAMSWEEFCHTLYEVTLFNVDITVSEMMNALHNLALYPAWQETLRQKIVSKEENSRQMLDAFLLESARLHPAIPITFPEHLTEDQIIGGYLIPAGSAVCVDVLALNKNPSIWTDANRFNPSRHLPAMTAAPMLMHRFGLGVRRCMGFRYANAMLRALTQHTLQHYRLSISESFANKRHTPIPMLPGASVCASLRFEILSSES